MVKAVLFDLDGVVRHFDPGHVAAIEARHGIAPGPIHRCAFSSPLIEQVTTGRMSRREWVAVVGQCIGSLAAAQEWGQQTPRVDKELLDLVDELTGHRYVTAILTNGTDTIPEEAQVLGLATRFDAVFNSAAIGYIKPDVRVFRHVLEALHLEGDEVFFTDDSASHLTGAERLGMVAHRFQGVPELRLALGAAGVVLDGPHDGA